MHYIYVTLQPLYYDTRAHTHTRTHTRAHTPSHVCAVYRLARVHPIPSGNLHRGYPD